VDRAELLIKVEKKVVVSKRRLQTKYQKAEVVGHLPLQAVLGAKSVVLKVRPGKNHLAGKVEEWRPAVPLPLVITIAVVFSSIFFLLM
jgi:hypothetical protein